MMSSKDTERDNADEMDGLLRSIVAEPNTLLPAKRKKQVKIEKKPEEDYAVIVEKYMVIFEAAFEDDVALNQQSKPCIHKLKKLPLLIQTLSKKKLLKTFITHGVFTLLKNWLEPLPDGSFPNFNIRQAILMILTNKFQFDVNQDFVKQQLKSSGLGKAIMFLSQSHEETASNQKLARDLVYNWSRSIYNISTRMEEARASNVERIPKRPCIRPTKKPPAAKDERDDLERQLETYDFSSGHKKIAKSILMSRAQIPEPTSMTFVISPPSKFDTRKTPQNNRQRDKITKKLKELRTMSTKSQQPIKVLTDGSIFWYCANSARTYSCL